MARRRRRARGTPPPLVAADHSPVPLAAPGPRTPRERSLALVMAAGVLAAASLGMGRAPQAPPPPACPPGGSVSWDDQDGCWEQRPDGTRHYRTSSRGRVFYHRAPPTTSRHYGAAGTRKSSGWSWFRSGGSSSSYRGSGLSGG